MQELYRLIIVLLVLRVLTSCIHFSHPYKHFSYHLLSPFLAAPQLLTVAGMGTLILFAYSVLGFVFYSSVFDPQMGLYCNNLFQCFVSIARIGLLDTLGEVNFHSINFIVSITSLQFQQLELRNSPQYIQYSIVINFQDTLQINCLAFSHVSNIWPTRSDDGILIYKYTCVYMMYFQLWMQNYDRLISVYTSHQVDQLNCD